MKTTRYCFLFFATLLTAAPSYAQWAVFDATNFGEAVKNSSDGADVHDGNQTRDEIIQAYNLAHYMSQMPQNLYQRYKAEFALWTNVNCTRYLWKHRSLGWSTEYGLFRRVTGRLYRAVVQSTPIRNLTSDSSIRLPRRRSRISTPLQTLRRDDHGRVNHSWPDPLPLRVA